MVANVHEMGSVRGRIRVPRHRRITFAGRSARFEKMTVLEPLFGNMSVEAGVR